MLASKVKFLLFIAMLMFVAKPFLGFSLRYQRYFKAQQPCSQNILVKSFAKRMLEFNENSEYNPAKMQAKLANPGLPVVTLFAFALCAILPLVLRQVKTITGSLLAAITYSICPPQPLYLLSGKLTI